MLDNLDNIENGTHDTEASSSDVQKHKHIKSADDPVYKPDTRPLSEASATEADFDIDAIMERVLNNGDVQNSSDGVSSSGKNDDASVAESSVSFNPTYEWVNSSTDLVNDVQLMQDMAKAVRELTEEVRGLRRQIDSATKPVSTYLKENQPDNSDSSAGSVDESPTRTGVSTDKKKTANRAVSVIGNILFYTVIVAMVVGAFLLRSTSNGKPFMIAGYSAANVLTSSMEDVYPKGSLIITKAVDASELKIGDDITFMVNEDSSVTHRIIGITENYQEMGMRAFETKGTMNADPDRDPVVAVNVIGKVIFYSETLGSIAEFVKNNWPLIIFIMAVLFVLIIFLKRMLRDDLPEPKRKQERIEGSDETDVNTEKQ